MEIEKERVGQSRHLVQIIENRWGFVRHWWERQNCIEMSLYAVSVLFNTFSCCITGRSAHTYTLRLQPENMIGQLRALEATSTLALGHSGKLKSDNDDCLAD